MREPTPEEMREIDDALARGHKIEAIRRCRQITGVDLKAAKDFVEARIPQLLKQDPRTYARAAPSQGAGCLSAVLALIGAAVAWGVFSRV